MDTSDESGRNEQSSLIVMRDMATCKTCGLAFMVVDWLPWRTEGYCSEACGPWRDLPVGNGKS